MALFLDHSLNKDKNMPIYGRTNLLSSFHRTVQASTLPVHYEIDLATL